jgi:citrate lyase subunit beta/citryl-CoA lyase
VNATRRALLFVPATAERFIAKAHERGADAIIVDLEDSIPQS